MEGALRPRRRLAAGDGRRSAQKGNGQLVYNADEFRWGGLLLADHGRGSPRTTCTPTGKHLRQLASRGRRDGRPDRSRSGSSRRTRRSSERPTGGTISVAYPANKITYSYDRKTNTYLRSVTGEAKQIDAATGKRVAPEERRRHAHALRAAQRRPARQAPARGRVVGKGKAWIATNGQTIKGTWEEVADRADPVLRRGRQPGHADRRPDVRPGHAAQRLDGHRSRTARSRRRVRQPGRRAAPRPGASRLGQPGAGQLAPDRRPPRRPPASRAATSAQVRRVRLGALAGDGRDAGRGRASSAQIVAQRDGQPVRVARLDEQPGRADELRQRPDRRRDDRRPARERLDDRQAGRLGDDRAGSRPGRRGRAPARPVVGQRRARRRARRRRPAGGGPGERGAVVRASRRRAGPAAATGRPSGRPAGRPAAASAASAREQRREVLAGVVAARVDEVALRRARGARARASRRRGRRSPPAAPAGANAGARRERHDPEPVAPDVQQPARGPGGRLRADDDRRRVAQELRPQPLAEPAGRATAGRPPASPTARGRAA